MCLPSEYSGCELIVQHYDKKVMEFDWSNRSISTVQWAAFYLECDRRSSISLVLARPYLFTSSTFQSLLSAVIHEDPIIEPQSLPLYKYNRELITNAAFKKGELYVTYPIRTLHC